MMTRGRLKAARERAERQIEETRKAEIERMKKSKEELAEPRRELIGALIPTIPNHITLQAISTKLPWSAVQTLSAVSRPWRQAVQNRTVYEARVDSGSTETLFVISNTLSDQTKGIVVYSLQSKACYQLPPNPHLESGIPESCECITLDGKIFVLGGLSVRKTELSSQEVFMLDMAGQRQWKQCASMQAARQNFGCGVINGKIYACGGSSCRAPVPGTEVYDPKIDAWTKLKPMLSQRTGHDVGVIEGELVAYGGNIFHPDYQELQEELRMYNVDPKEWNYLYRAQHVEVYNPITNEWRRLSKDFRRHDTHSRCKRLFVAESGLHSLIPGSILALDLQTDSETRVHSVRGPVEVELLGNSRSIRTYWPRAIQAADDVLLSIQTYCDQIVRNSYRLRFILLQSRGFGTDDEQIVWETAPVTLSFDGLKCPFIRTIRL